MLRTTAPRHMVPKITVHPNKVCQIVLDAPKSLNAVDHEAVLHMRDLLLPHIYKHNKQQYSGFVIRGAGAKAFCSGGDVVSIATEKPKDVRHKFFYTEYQVNHAIGEVGVPYVALWNGITMGGGFGVSIHGTHRVAVPNTLFAMPETAIGLFPDVGGSWVLPRLPYEGLGLFLALSGARLKGSDLVHAGLATHFAPSVEKLDELETKLIAEGVSENFFDSASGLVASKSDMAPFSLAKDIERIKKHFGSHHQTLHNVLDSLRSESHHEDRVWASDLLAKLHSFSPTSVAVSFEAARRGGQFQTRAEMFEMEYRLSQSMSNHNDFYAGVDALLLTKHKKPKWAPASLEELDDGDVAKLFEKRDPRQPTWDPTTPEETAFEAFSF